MIYQTIFFQSNEFTTVCEYLDPLHGKNNIFEYSISRTRGEHFVFVLIKNIENVSHTPTHTFRNRNKESKENYGEMSSIQALQLFLRKQGKSTNIRWLINRFSKT